MITLLIIAACLLGAAVLGKVWYSSLRPQDGYEDELGFHYGSEPTRHGPFGSN